MTAIRDADDSRTEEDGLLQLPQNFTANETMTGFEEHSTDVDRNSSIDVQMTTDEKRAEHANKIDLRQMHPLSSDLFAARSKDTTLDIRNLTLSTPDGKRTLIQNLDMSIGEGEHLLIVGNSGAGKSSLLRAIAGLWTTGSGVIERPNDSDIYFLPQRPYCALGSLKDQLLYPSLDEDEIDEQDYPEGHRLSRSHLLRQSLTDQDLLDILTEVDLGDLAERSGDGDPIKGLYKVLDWSNTLSLGEQQRLAFGRLLVNRPRFVILDEATSALDMVAESKMYKLLQDRAQKNLVSGKGLSRAGLTYVSVGHRPSLLIYHDKRLRLMGEKGYSIEKIEKSSTDTSPLGVTNM